VVLLHLNHIRPRVRERSWNGSNCIISSSKQRLLEPDITAATQDPNINILLALCGENNPTISCNSISEPLRYPPAIPVTKPAEAFYSSYPQVPLSKYQSEMVT
jgi:hypothetical protein